jgi:hypothetical protein
MEAQASLLDEALDGGEHAGSAPSFRLNGLSNGSATKKQKTRPAAPDVDPMDMIDLEDDSPSYTGPLACPACSTPRDPLFVYLYDRRRKADLI